MTGAASPSHPPRAWTAIVLAGQRPGVDRLSAAFGGETKALIPLAGTPMLVRVLASLRGVPAIARIIVLGLDPAVVAPALLASIIADPRLSLAASAGGISRSILALLDRPDLAYPVLVTTADHPLLTAAMVGGFLARSGDHGLAVAMVARTTIERAYPGNRRTYLRFSDGDFSGANLFALHDASVRPALAFWAGAEADRKKVWTLFRRFGLGLALRAITRTISASAAFRRAGGRIGVDARFVVLDEAEAAIDVDKPSDYALAEDIIRAREAHAQAG